MNMLLLQLFINGLVAGSLYALVASGFSLIYSTNHFLHFAHGVVVTVGAYALYSFFSLFGLPFFISVLLAIVSSGLLGWLMYAGLYRPLKKRGSSGTVLLVASIGLLILIENIVLLLFGGDVQVIKYGETASVDVVGGVMITKLQIVIIVVSLVMLVALFLFTRWSKLGRTLRAVADNRELSEISGIDIGRIESLSFVIGSAIAGLAAVLIALEQNIEPMMGAPLFTRGFTGAIIGGATSLPGAVLGSYLLGLIENYGIWWLPSGYKDAIVFVLLFVFLLFRPTGIFGINKGAKR